MDTLTEEAIPCKPTLVTMEPTWAMGMDLDMRPGTHRTMDIRDTLADSTPVIQHTDATDFKSSNHDRFLESSLRFSEFIFVTGRICCLHFLDFVSGSACTLSI